MKMKALKIGITLALSSIALFSIAGYFGKLHYLLELTSHFKAQYLILSLLFLVICLTCRHKTGILLSLFCIGINFIEVVPWYLPKAQIGDRTSFQEVRIFQSNVLTDNQQYKSAIAVVRQANPDIAVFVEVSQKWVNELKALSNTFPYVFSQPDSDEFGTAIYSKIPFVNPTVQEFGGSRKTLISELRIGDREIQLIVTHPDIPLYANSFSRRNRQLAEMSRYIGNLKRPIVMVGDFNITMWSPFYRDFVRQSDLRNSRYSFGLLPTWPTMMPLFYIPIDHCLISPEIRVKNVQTGQRVGSDHLPLISDLLIPRSF